MASHAIYPIRTNKRLFPHRLARPVDWPAAGLLVLLSVSVVVLLPWPLAATCLAGALVLFLLLIHPAYDLLLLPFAIPFGFWAWRGLPFHLPDLLVMLLLAFWLFRDLGRRQLSWRLGDFFWPLLFLFVALGISFWYALSPAQALPEWFKWGEVLAVYLATLNVWPKRWLPWLVAVMLLAGALEALVGLRQFYLRLGPDAFLVLGGRFKRAFGDFAQPNPFGGYLGLMLPFGVSLSLWETTRLSRSWRQNEPHPIGALGCALAIWLLTAFIAAGLLASWSRGGWLGAAASSLIVLLFFSRATFWLTVGGGSLVVLLNWIEQLHLIPAVLLARLGSFQDWLLFLHPVLFRATPVDSTNFAILERTAHWLSAWNMWLAYPWHGVGIGNYPVAYPAFQISLWREALGHAHNIYLNFLAESGVIGFAAYLLLFLWATIVVLRLLTRTKGFDRAIVLGALGFFVHLSVHNLFDNLYVHGLQLFLGLVLGILALMVSSLADENGR